VAYPDYDPSFTISRQVPAYTLPADAKPLFSWKPGAAVPEAVPQNGARV
jgi:hypothetical protein